jgi:hypothetical protein
MALTLPRTFRHRTLVPIPPTERSPMTPTTAHDEIRLAPPCPECAVALLPVGGGRHTYWTCAWCATTMPRW